MDPVLTGAASLAFLACGGGLAWKASRVPGGSARGETVSGLLVVAGLVLLGFGLRSALGAYG